MCKQNNCFFAHIGTLGKDIFQIYQQYIIFNILKRNTVQKVLFALIPVEKNLE